jgi:hypothetical protein
MSIRGCRRFAAVALFACALALVASVQAGEDPWSKLNVGDWAEYKASPAPGIETRMKWVVKSADADQVVYSIETTTMMNGQAMGQPVSTEMTYDRKAMAAATTTAPADAPKPVESEETVTVDGKQLKCRVVELEAAGQKSKSWMSEEVPFGIVKVESNGVVSQELVRWGNAGS